MSLTIIKLKWFGFRGDYVISFRPSMLEL